MAGIILLNINKIALIHSCIVSPRSVTVHRRLADTTGDHGQIVLEIKNWLSHDMDVTFFQTTPWYMKLYLHSMRITRITAESGISQPAQDVLLSQLYLPAADRIRPAVLEMRLRLPANTTLRIVTAFDKAFLKYTEYPPDANRGFDVGPAVLTINKVQSDAEQR
jgi:phosphatidylinositol glycan class T